MVFISRKFDRIHVYVVPSFRVMRQKNRLVVFCKCMLKRKTLAKIQRKSSYETGPPQRGIHSFRLDKKWLVPKAPGC